MKSLSQEQLIFLTVHRKDIMIDMLVRESIAHAANPDKISTEPMIPLRRNLSRAGFRGFADELSRRSRTKRFGEVEVSPNEVKEKIKGLNQNNL